MGHSITRRPILSIIIAVVLVGGVVAALNSGLVSCAKSSGSKASRPLNDDELRRLAAMRQHNFGDGRVGVQGTVGSPGQHIAITGWVDWRRALIYLSVTQPADGSVSLVQARPGVLAVRPAALDIQGPPPPQPPADGWRVRPLNLSEKQETPLDNLVAFLFLMARDKTDNAELLGRLNNQWVRKDNAQGTEVDVLLGPAVLPEAEPSAPASASPRPDPHALDTHGGAVGYWLDAAGRLRKVETLLGPNMPTSIDFKRDDPQEFHAIDALGGRNIAPREVTSAEAELLALMRQRNYHARTASVTVTLPAMPGTLRQASGWLDWQRGVSYLSVRDLDDSEKDVLIHVNRAGVSLRKPGGPAPEAPPLPAPADEWEIATWGQLSGTPELTDLDIVLFEIMSLAINQRDDVTSMRTMARRLRIDALGGEPMGVFELPNSIEQQWAPGTARLRYWVDNAGVLRRLEARTQTGGFLQLDLTPGAKIPGLPASVE